MNTITRRISILALRLRYIKFKHPHDSQQKQIEMIETPTPALGTFEISLRAWPRRSTNDIIPAPDDYAVIKPTTELHNETYTVDAQVNHCELHNNTEMLTPHQTIDGVAASKINARD